MSPAFLMLFCILASHTAAANLFSAFSTLYIKTSRAFERRSIRHCELGEAISSQLVNLIVQGIASCLIMARSRKRQFEMHHLHAAASDGFFIAQ